MQKHQEFYNGPDIIPPPAIPQPLRNDKMAMTTSVY